MRMIQSKRNTKSQGMILGLLLLATLPMGCATSQERMERLAETQQAVAEALAGRHWKIRVTSMSPARYSSRMVSYGYFLELKGDTLESYLPYVGRVYQAPAFSTSQGLNFEETILNYQEARAKKDMTRMELQVKTREDLYHFFVEVYDNGRATIRVRAQNRDGISFDGDCDVTEREAVK